MGTSIAATAGANAGTSPPTPVLGPGAVDWRGSVAFGTGTAPAPGSQVTLKSGVAYTGNGVTAQGGLGIAVTPLNAATAALGPWFPQWDSISRSVSFYCIGTPAASQANTVYALSYLIYSD